MGYSWLYSTNHSEVGEFNAVISHNQPAHPIYRRSQESRGLGRIDPQHFKYVLEADCGVWV